MGGKLINKERLAAFTDAILALIMTILVLELEKSAAAAILVATSITVLAVTAGIRIYFVPIRQMRRDGRCVLCLPNKCWIRSMN